MQPYSKSAPAGLWRNTFRAGSLLTAGIVAFSAAGCSTSYQLGSLFGSGGSQAGAQSATAYAPVEGSRKASLEQPTETDLTIAKAAAAELLARGSKDASQWENPRSGARGAITPIASDYVRDGATCRDFLVSHVRGSHENWYQGSACRAGARWQVRELRPLRRS